VVDGIEQATTNDFIRNMVSEYITVNPASTLTALPAKYDDVTVVPQNPYLDYRFISGYEVSGCARRRRKLLSTDSVLIAITYSVNYADLGYASADALYDQSSENLAEAITTMTADLTAQYGSAVSIDTIKLELSTRTEPVETTYNPPAPAPVVPYYAGADCPNGCSGHGSCSTNGCVCWSHWGNGDETGGACDQRKCPYEPAWVDTPSAENKAHALRECAGRGICDRETGDCQCFPGFEGKGCRRSSCPNGCSGHGTCEFLSEMRNDLGDTFKWTGSKPTRDQYDFEFPLMWDAHKTRGCVCDPKYMGLDCSQRMCPRGDYAHYFQLEKKPETQAVIFTNVFNPVTDLENGAIDYKTSSMNAADTNGEFALTFRSTLNEEFTTNTLNVYNLTEAIVEDAINSLPNKVIEEASVELFRNLSKYNATNYNILASNAKAGQMTPNRPGYPYDPAYNYTWYDTDLVVLITFAGAMTSGDQYALECRTAYCGAGCQPRLMYPLDFKKGSSCSVVNNFEEAVAVNWECSGRGECLEDGVCECYEGYTDEYCSTKTAII